MLLIYILKKNNHSAYYSTALGLKNVLYALHSYINFASYLILLLSNLMS
jgi:hypothetical protein